MRWPASLPVEISRGPFSIAQASALGVGRHRLRAADLRAPYPGIRTSEVVAETLHDRCLEYLPRLDHTQFFSHVTAAALLGMPLPGWITHDDLHVSTAVAHQRPRARGVRGHSLTRTPVITHNGIPVASPVHTWCQLAAVLDWPDLVVVGDFLVQRKRPLATMDQLAAAVARSGGRGIRSLRRALGLIRARTDSPQETRLRLVIVGAGLPEPVVGYVVRDSLGTPLGTPDLAFVEHRILLEYQGEQHWRDPRVYADDIVRRELMEAAGWLVVYVTARDLGYRSAIFLAKLADSLRARAPNRLARARPTPPVALRRHD